MIDQEKAIEEEKKKLEKEYNHKFNDLRDHEKKRIEKLRKEYSNIDEAIKLKADNLKILKIGI